MSNMLLTNKSCYLICRCIKSSGEDFILKLYSFGVWKTIKIVIRNRKLYENYKRMIQCFPR